MDILKFIDLTTIAGVLEVQVNVLTQTIEEDHPEDVIALFKSELVKLKSSLNKIKKMINNY